jgi:hypothetical protein
MKYVYKYVIRPVLVGVCVPVSKVLKVFETMWTHKSCFNSMNFSSPLFSSILCHVSIFIMLVAYLMLVKSCWEKSQCYYHISHRLVNNHLQRRSKAHWGKIYFWSGRKSNGGMSVLYGGNKRKWIHQSGIRWVLGHSVSGSMRSTPALASHSWCKASHRFLPSSKPETTAKGN